MTEWSNFLSEKPVLYVTSAYSSHAGEGCQQEEDE